MSWIFALKIILNGNPAYPTNKGAAVLFEGVLLRWMDKEWDGSEYYITCFLPWPPRHLCRQ